MEKRVKDTGRGENPISDRIWNQGFSSLSHCSFSSTLRVSSLWAVTKSDSVDGVMAAVGPSGIQAQDPEFECPQEVWLLSWCLHLASYMICSLSCIC